MEQNIIWIIMPRGQGNTLAWSGNFWHTKEDAEIEMQSCYPDDWQDKWYATPLKCNVESPAAPIPKELDALVKAWVTKNSGLRLMLTPEFVRETYKEAYIEALKSHPFNNEDMLNAAWYGCHGFNSDHFKQWLIEYKASKTVI